MLTLLRRLFSSTPPASRHAATSSRLDQAPPPDIDAGPGPALGLVQHMRFHGGFPYMDWPRLLEWKDALPPERRAQAWLQAEQAWLLHFRDALGPHFRVDESEHALLLSSLEDNVVRATLAFMEKTLKRVTHTLDGIAAMPPMGKDILIVFDDEDSYYRYVAAYYPDAGEFAFSGGMHIDAGCSHYVTLKGDLHAIEPVIAHEMTHGLLGHLPLPLWLNEGIAVNTEQRLTRVGASKHTPQELRQMHLTFWGEEELQQFWSGKSFQRVDDGNLLSYDLARILVGHLAKDWDAFRRFVLAADAADAGNAAALEQLGVGVGELACALLEREPSAAWSPDPASWKQG